MKICPSCEINYNESSKFCRKCGGSLVDEQEFPQIESLPYEEQRLRKTGPGDEKRELGLDSGKGWQFPSFKIAAPAYKFLMGSGVLVVLGLVFSLWPIVVLGLGVGGFLAYCFRDPERAVPSDPEVVVSPADGTVLFVDTVWEDRFLNASARRVAISLNLLDVHVNRAPVAGVVVKTEHQPGQFSAPVGSKADRTNERRLWMLADEDDRRFLVVQMAGQLTRRILPFAQGGQRLDRGERLGMICFGSRVDLFLPLEAHVSVAPGARVLAGTDVVARLR
jgi:phosphatidylserine decarboxylase